MHPPSTRLLQALASKLLKEKKQSNEVQTVGTFQPGVAPNQPPSIVKPIEILFSVVLAFVGASNLPIEWRVGTWLLCAILVLHLILFTEYFKGKMDSALRICVVFIVPLAICLAFHNEIREKRISEHAAVMSGVLTPEDASIPWPVPTDEYPVIVGGDSSYGFQIKAPDGGALGMDSDMLKLKIVRGEVLLSTTVRDQFGNTVVQITDNQWNVSSNQQQSWDKNYDDHALEVLDGQHKLVFQVRLYKNGVRVQGHWYGNRTFDQQGKTDPMYGTVPLFKYPSYLYWSKRTGSYLP